MALLWGLLVLSLSCLRSPCSALMSGQTQQKLPLLSLLKLGNQEPGGQTAPKKAPGDCKGSPNPEQTRRLAQAMMAFTTDLFSLVAQSSTRPNLILSPLSVALALSHLALGTVGAPVQTSRAGRPVGTHYLPQSLRAGAQNQTLQRLQQVLHVDSGPCLPHRLSRLCQDLGPGAFRLAARMYLQKGFPIKEDFVEQSEQLFGAKPMSLTGRKRDDLANINQWVKEATEGKIEDFLSDLPDDTVLLLLNAIHFQGFWRRKFDPDLTQRDTFHLDEQFTVPVDMMQAQTYPLRWFLLEQPEIQVAHFPFKNNMSFVVIMPTHFEWNVSQVLANLSWGILHQPLLRERPTKVQLPKLHLKYQMDLVAILSQLGLQELFQAPDLRGISDQSLVVSSVQHQSTLELREAGVEAAATTSTAMSRMSLSSFSVNRPFLFFILEDSTSLPLFVGSVRNPNPGAQPEPKEQQDSPDNRDLLQHQKVFPCGDKPFGPDLKLVPPSEEDYPQPSSPK
ncbi:alpha-2-antiplasmin isoform 2-T2 [Megaptera novaeangliae]